MPGFLVWFFTIVLSLASILMILLVLMQRGSDGGAGAAIGGGAMESAFGGETNKVLTRATVTLAIVFFVVGLGMYLGQIAAHKKAVSNTIALEKIVAKAQANADKAAAQNTQPQPKPGEVTAEAMKVLAAETKEGAKQEQVVPAVQKATTKDATPQSAESK